MADRSSTKRRRWQWPAAIPLVILLWLTLSRGGRATWTHFFDSLRIARPEGVSVTVPAFSGPAGSRRLVDAVVSMLADSVRVTREDQDSSVADPVAAGHLAGFTPGLSDRAGPTAFAVMGARAITVTVARRGLQTIFREGGLSDVNLPATLDKATLSVEAPAGIRATSGHCPMDDQATLTDQLAQRPPPSMDNGDCVVIEERPVVKADVPPGLDMQQLTGIALEVAGMSPNQQRDFQRIFPWQAALALTMPRFMRSYEVVDVNGVPAMLLNTAGRRGPTYALLWTTGGRAYSLTGYGSTGDAVPIANSIH
jgi:hypothetical protein